ncbi:hypothetical protein P154DRAFT_442493 [Amniculicola lignicola CBS 123094]|uniref:BHLH domain-containing protein n=1 Tax=Amniculicola lignicola CBS 123094 TaxID=1392246 RepID=A0A6A5WCN1_9PLEO|nr:hypothetical protein P154DRAFT_442493 [Amniculicola lignicola CBS 123094]
MPRPNMPPTPAPSTDIAAKPAANNAAQFDSSFALPPAALGSTSRGSTSSSATSNASDSSYRPLSPSSPIATAKTSPASRKRSSTTQSIVTKDDYSLPPPPTRSRKIIQMKPKEQQDPAKTQAPASAGTKATPAPVAGTKRKQTGNGTAAGRKIARKTAHSLIERRRRSKMNEEFGVLKDMIPACTGQEMHKLAILQASIEYMRYLEQCVSDLKRSRRASPTATSPHLERPVPRLPPPEAEDDDEEDEEDEDMEDAISPRQVSKPEPKTTFQFTQVSPAIYPSDRSVYSSTTSPNIYPSDKRHYSVTISPALQPSDPRHYSLSSSIRSTQTSPSIHPSVHPSPAFGGHTPSQAQFQNPFTSAKGSAPGPTGSNFELTSPALGPQADREDHEATEALLMLNTDRRSWNGARGMSVKDLLSG